MMKKILIMTMLVLAIMTTAVFAANSEVINIYVDGERLQFSEGMGNPFISAESRTMIPLRAVSEGLGYEVAWDQENFSAIVRGNDIEIVLPINKNFGYVNGERKTFDTYTIIADGRTYVPLRFVSENLEKEVKWQYGRDARANNVLAHIIDLTDKIAFSSQGNKLEIEGFTLENEEFQAILESFGTIQEVAGTGGNIQVGPYGYAYHHKNVDLAFYDFGITIPSERSDLDHEIEFSFGGYSEDELNQFTTSLKYLLGTEHYETIDSISDKLDADIKSTKKNGYFDTITLNGKSFTIDDLTVRYFQNATIFYVYVGY